MTTYAYLHDIQPTLAPDLTGPEKLLCLAEQQAMRWKEWGWADHATVTVHPAYDDRRGEMGLELVQVYIEDGFVYRYRLNSREAPAQEITRDEALAMLEQQATDESQAAWRQQARAFRNRTPVMTTTTTLREMSAADFIEGLKRAYSNLNYDQFCEVLDIKADDVYAEDKWRKFQSLMSGIGAFSAPWLLLLVEARR